MSITALLAGLFSGIIGAMGLGGGAVLIIYLSLFTETEQLAAQGINLLFFIPTALLAVTVYGIKKQIEWKLALKIALWGLLGTAAGLYFTHLLGNGITSKIFGGLLCLMGLKEFFGTDRKNLDKRDKS
ncbi:MAG: sulfite exporter TauE/SafE family protein [Clostridia bacterium]|nr:sulfite exporter TauE/SafE family protein [Clostridia bacterium]